MHASELMQPSRERLINDLDNVVSDVELLIKASAGQAGEAYDSALAKLGTSLQSARSRVEVAQRRIAENACAATHATDAYVHANAWKMIAVAALGGLLAGLVVARR